MMDPNNIITVHFAQIIMECRMSVPKSHVINHYIPTFYLLSLMVVVVLLILSLYVGIDVKPFQFIY